MPALLSPRDIVSEAGDVKNTFSSWDSCMSEDYCKYPVIVAIVVGSLIAISLIWCCARCLCCGAECCCGCLSCFNHCCPSPRRKHEGYQQPPANYPPSQQYHSPAPPMYFGGGYRPAQTATFDAPSHKGGAYNEDALPAMPSWDNAQSRRVEEYDVEMEKLDHHAGQEHGLLGGNDRYYNNHGHQQQDTADIGNMHASPYHDYSQHQQYATSPTSTAAPSMYPPTYHTRAQSTVYEPSIPPSYHTAPSVASPVAQQPQYGVPRRPVQGSWRDV